jgi:ankyrin repeat protein
LLERGANLEAQGRFRQTALHEAAYHGHVGVARILLDKGANLGTQSRNYGTPLHVAARFDNSGVAQILLEKGALLEARGRTPTTSFLYTPLHVACIYGSPGVAQILLERGADVNAQAGARCPTPLHIVSQSRGAKAKVEEIVRLLLDRGADVDARCKDGFTPLYFASQNERVGVVRLLLDRGAEVDSVIERCEVEQFFRPEIVAMLREAQDSHSSKRPRLK